MELLRLAQRGVVLCLAALATVAVAVALPGCRKAPAEIEIVESWPLETSLDHVDVRDAAAVWPEMIDRAKKSLEVAEFYASEAEGDAVAESRLAPIVAAVERAVGRGVRVRFLADSSFAPKYPATLDRLRRAGVTVRTIDVGKLAGGILHAKYFVVDGAESFVGSQNFDWRALAHIQEMGVRVRSAEIAGALLDVFETDWTLADGGDTHARVRKAHKGTVVAGSGETLGLVASPQGWLPDESAWDLPRLVGLVDGAKKELLLQVLTYSVENRDKTPFTTLDEALRRAAGRGVRVRMLVSHWATKTGSASRRSLEELARVAKVEVRVITIPPWSRGEIPFARVSHAKYLVVDGTRAWVGTSNWEGDYFLKSRNVGVIADGGRVAPRLAGIFEDGWASPYTAEMKPPVTP